MAKDINIHIKTPGAQQAKQQLDDIGRSSQKVGDKTSRGARKGAEGMDRLSSSATKTEGRFSKLTSSLTSWVLKLAGIAAAIRAVTFAIRAQSEAIKEHAQIASEQQKKLLELQYLGEFFKERPELRKEVAAYAEFGRRPFEEVAQAWYNLRSKAARLTPQQRESILKESLELGRMYPSAPLSTLVDMFSLYVKQTGARDINRVQNVLLQTITEAGGGMADVAKYMPQFLPIGMAGGLTGPQAAGLWAYVTTQLAEPSIATTGLKATFLGLQGRGTPEAQKIMQQLGISSDMDFFEKLRILSTQQQAGRFGLAEAERFAGREGAAVLLSILKDRPAMMQTIANVVGVTRGGRDITKGMIQQLMGRDEIARLEENIRLFDIAIQNIKGDDIRALRWQELYKQWELEMREAGWPEWLIRTELMTMRGIGAVAPGLMEPTSPVIVNDNSINYYPCTGTDERGPRFTQD